MEDTWSCPCRKWHRCARFGRVPCKSLARTNAQCLPLTNRFGRSCCRPLPERSPRPGVPLEPAVIARRGTTRLLRPEPEPQRRPSA
eukprot:4551148-Alexandrium_andersonii.AAC.1